MRDVEDDAASFAMGLPVPLLPAPLLLTLCAWMIRLMVAADDVEGVEDEEEGDRGAIAFGAASNKGGNGDDDDGGGCSGWIRS